MKHSFLLCWGLVVTISCNAGEVRSASQIHRHTREKSHEEPKKKRFIVQVKNEKGRHSVESIVGTGTSQEIYKDFVSVDLDETQIAALAQDEDILDLDEDTEWTVLGFREEDEALYPDESIHNRHLAEVVSYGIKDVQADLLNVGSSPVMVCLVDSGLAAGHPDINWAITSGVDRISNDGSPMPWDVDTNGHGTHISGVISARIDNDLGVRGIGNIPLFIARALNDQQRAFQSDIMGAMRACQQSGAKIISVSLGGSYITRSMRDLIAELYDDGMLLVSASGNDGKMRATYPAAHRDVISVTALKQGRELWEFSNTGPWIEMAAPGHRIYSTYPPDGYALYSGTSNAVPFVSGVAALVWSHFPTCRNTQIRYALAKTAQDLGEAGCDPTFGYGLVQARAAYEFLLANPCEEADWGKVPVTGMCSTLIDPTAQPTTEPTMVCSFYYFCFATCSQRLCTTNAFFPILELF